MLPSQSVLRALPPAFVAPIIVPDVARYGAPAYQQHATQPELLIDEDESQSESESEDEAYGDYQGEDFQGEDVNEDEIEYEDEERNQDGLEIEVDVAGGDQREDYEISDDEDEQNARNLLRAPQPPISRRRGVSIVEHIDPTLLPPHKRLRRNDDPDGSNGRRNPIQVQLIELTLISVLKPFFSRWVPHWIF